MDGWTMEKSLIPLISAELIKDFVVAMFVRDTLMLQKMLNFQNF